MDKVCHDCGAKHWKSELPANATANKTFWMSCCKAGAAKVDLLKEPPQYLKDLYESTDARGQTFKNNLRRYNAAFAFTSLRCEVSSKNISNMPFQIHGQMYHTQGPLSVEDSNQAKYAQLYIFDSEYAASIRSLNNSELDNELIRELSSVIHRCNPYVHLYKTAHEILEKTDEEGSFIRVYPSMRIELVAGRDRRTENVPTANEVAGILPNESSSDTFRVIRIYLRNSEHGPSFSTISQTHALYIPLHYTLLFPMGDLGWNWGMRLEGEEDIRLTQRVYYRFRLHLRDQEFPTIFLAKRLFQQYLVDIWAICDQTKLDWIKTHQSNIRADLYNGVQDALISEDVDATSLGRRFILPSSYTGGPRFMAKQYQDSMAIVRYFGKPSLFITFTANPGWIEIKRELLPGQNASDRPDLVARVFNAKVKELLKDLKTKNVFGTYRGLVRTIEYQKRGLPHLHLLLFLDSSSNINSAEKIDKIISAEIPSKKDEPELFEIITKRMVHGPCGDINPRSPCMVKDAHGIKKCSKSFPKQFTEQTVVSEDGYPLYKRNRSSDPDTHFSIDHPMGHGDRFQIDNRWIVPYNPYLSKKFAAHINVECCQSVQAIKYINKYVYKGSDKSTMKLSDTENEIEKHLQGRYIGPTEAFGHIFEYKTHEEDPTVTLQALHLPGHQPIFFPEDATPDELQHKLINSRTMLMGYFHYYTTNPTAAKYLYQDFPQYFVWQKKERCWKPRQKGFAIGRVPYCSPQSGERFYLRLLLTNVAGAKSFEDLRTVNGIQYETFKHACLMLHLIEDDQEWNYCFNEAVVFSTGSSLRDLFITALTFGQLIEPALLWEQYCTHICDDLKHKLRSKFSEQAHEKYLIIDETLYYKGKSSWDYGLYLIDAKLGCLGYSLETYNMPAYKNNWSNDFEELTNIQKASSNSLINEQLAYDAESEKLAYESKYALFNEDQKTAFDTIVYGVQQAWVESNLPNSPVTQNTSTFFLHGPAGTGKTFVYNTLCNYFRSQKKIVLCVASSGIAALLLSGGRTSHFRFKIPIAINRTSTCYITKKGDLADLLQKTELIIWDEVPMQNKLCFEAVDRTLQDIRGVDQMFGGIPVVLGGDFAQIPPVIKHGNRTMIVDASIRNSYIWHKVEIIHLRINMRVRGTSTNDAHFKKWLNLITYNTSFQNQSIPIPVYISQVHSLDELISKVYPQNELDNSIQNSQFFFKTAILTTQNSVVDTLNLKILSLMPGDTTVMLSADTVDTSNQENNELNRVSPEYLQTLNPSNFPPAKLNLKKGCIIMLLRNINPQKGLCNGTRLIVKNILSYTLIVAVIHENGSETEQIEIIPRIQISTLENEYPFILTRKQFPVKLSFAMTINKSQGQSLTNVGIDLRNPTFTHGQVYVALSRSTNLKGIHILHAPKTEGLSDDKIENIVYPELLL